VTWEPLDSHTRFIDDVKKGADFNRCGAARLKYSQRFCLWDNRALFSSLI
jgi:hypothetical protein